MERLTLFRMKPLPQKFEEFIRQQLGGELAAFLSCLQEPPPTSVRRNPLKYKSLERDQPVPWTIFGEYLSERPVFTLDPLLHAGAYYVQEASSMFLEQAMKQTLDLNKSQNVLDLSAAPGGKSTHILSLISRDSLLVSNEVIRPRASTLSENIQKWGYPNAIVSNNDPSDFGRLPGFFDVVVVDAPCSGEGLFRKEPAAIGEWSPQNVQLCASRQKRIIADVWNSLREGGVFIYCTCTYNPSENEENLQWLQDQQSVEFLKLETEPEWGVEEINRGKVIGYRFFPHRLRGEGFFLAALRKLGAADSTRLKTQKSVATPSRKIQDRLNDWVIAPEQSRFYQFNDLLFYAPAPKAKEVEILIQSLKIMYAGTNVATIKHDKLIPEHALALSHEANREHFTVIDVNKEDALRYLRRENLQFTALKGFALLTYQGLPIGWVNVLANRVNNMYPADWRVRMVG